ncbi:ATP-binding protein [Ferrovibrio sp.]|uniref:sensor histidine kinase n=1 Tax=Ferrovibrio sp. TaxID=1917215 RepID=UPI0035AE0D01
MRNSLRLILGKSPGQGLGRLPRLMVVLFALLVLAGIWGIAANQIYAYRDRLHQDAYTELEGAQKALHAHMRRAMEATLVMMATTDYLLADGLTAMNDVEHLLQKLQSFDVEPIQIGLVDQQRMVWRLGARDKTTDVHDRDYVAALRQADAGQIYVAAVNRSRLSGQEVITLAMKASHNRHGIDIIVATVPTLHFKEAYRDLLLSAPTFLGILRQDGLVLYLTRDEAGVVGDRLPVGFLDELRRNQGNNGVVEYTASRNVRRLLAGYAFIDNPPLVAFVGIDKTLLDQKWRDALPLPLALGGGATLLVLGFMALILWLMARSDAEALRVREALHQAEAANEAKRHFMARMSHELRTPLNAILGFSEVIGGGMLGPISQTYQRYGLDIHRSGEHLLSLVNQVLEIARLDAGAALLQDAPLTLSETISQAVETMRHAADAKHLSISVGTLPDMRLQADPLLLRQMLLNLLSNAVKYSEPGGHIEVAASRQRDGLAITVRDTGCGISEDEKPHIFEPFGHGNAMVARPQDGFRLGLPIVRALIELHGGRIELQSALRQGTAATLHFPPRRVLDAA